MEGITADDGGSLEIEAPRLPLHHISHGAETPAPSTVGVAIFLIGVSNRTAAPEPLSGSRGREGPCSNFPSTNLKMADVAKKVPVSGKKTHDYSQPKMLHNKANAME